MNKNRASSNPLSIFSGGYIHRQLIVQMTKREVISRYKGSVVGIFWSLFNPLLMLCVYTFVFSVVFDAKWGGERDGSRSEFAVVLFAGMVIFNLFSECLLKAPDLIVNNVNYVKKVVFPLETLGWVTICSALFHASVSLMVLLLAQMVVFGYIPVTLVWLPILVLPYMLGLLGLVWFVSASGVFLRDLSQIAGVITTVVMFSSPLFFPMSALPDGLAQVLAFNPMAYMIEEFRHVVVWGGSPSPTKLGMAYLVGSTLAWGGFAWFQRARTGFADVL